MSRILVRIARSVQLSTGEVVHPGGLVVVDEAEAHAIFRAGCGVLLMEGREVVRQSRVVTQPQVAAYVDPPRGRYGPH